MTSYVLLKGPSQYGALHLHIDELAKAIEANGHKAHILDIGNGQIDGTYCQQIRDEKPGFVFSINVGIDFRIGQYTFGQVFRCPHICQLVDHPSFHLDRLRAADRDIIVTCLDHSHASYVKQMFGADHFRAVDVVPPGGNGVGHGADTDFDKRDIPILFTGTLRKPPKTTWIEDAGAAGVVLDNVLERALAEDMLPVEDALAAELTERGLIGDEALHKGLLEMMRAVTDQVHIVRRWSALNALAKAGAPVHVYGKGWEGQMYRFKSFTFGGEGSFAETLDLLRRTKIVLNTNTNFVAGAHERTFAAMAGGAAVLSDVSRYYEDRFTPGDDILLYRWSDLDSLTEQASAWLDRPDALAALAQAGRDKVQAEHSWTNRFEDMRALSEAA